MRRLVLYYLGNTLILCSIIGFVLIFYPILKLYFFPSPVDKILPDKRDFFIYIPKINAQAPIIPGVNPWNQTEYSKALAKGVAQAKGTATPGGKGTIFMFAHSSGLPWEETWYNTAFLRLGELNLHDNITIYWNSRKYTYFVTAKKIVWPNQISFLQDIKENQLILQTCYPIGTSLQRLLVFAKPQ